MGIIFCTAINLLVGSEIATPPGSRFPRSMQAKVGHKTIRRDRRNQPNPQKKFSNPCEDPNMKTLVVIPSLQHKYMFSALLAWMFSRHVDYVDGIYSFSLDK